MISWSWQRLPASSALSKICPEAAPGGVLCSFSVVESRHDMLLRKHQRVLFFLLCPSYGTCWRDCTKGSTTCGLQATYEHTVPSATLDSGDTILLLCSFSSNVQQHAVEPCSSQFPLLCGLPWMYAALIIVLGTDSTCRMCSCAVLAFLLLVSAKPSIPAGDQLQSPIRAPLQLPRARFWSSVEFVLLHTLCFVGGLLLLCIKISSSALLMVGGSAWRAATSACLSWK